VLAVESHLREDLDSSYKLSHTFLILQFAFELVHRPVGLYIGAWVFTPNCDLWLLYYTLLGCLFFILTIWYGCILFPLGKAFMSPQSLYYVIFNLHKVLQIHLHSICFKKNKPSRFRHLLKIALLD